MSIFFFGHNLVYFAHRDMSDTSVKSCAHGLYFVFLHLRTLCNLLGRYDLKTKNGMFLAYNCVIFSHGIMCSTTIESPQ